MAMAFPTGWGLPAELGQMVFLGASSVSAVAATCQERGICHPPRKLLGKRALGKLRPSWAMGAGP